MSLGFEDVGKKILKTGVYSAAARFAPTAYNMARSYAKFKFRTGSRRSTARGARTRSGRSYTQTKTRKKRMRSGQGVTEQYDRKLIYAKSNMPRFKKRRWKRFKQKVNAIAEKELGTQQVLFNTAVTSTNDTSGLHITQTIGLYPNRSSTSHLNDLVYLAGLGNQSNATFVDGPSRYSSSKILFQSGILDLTIQNRSSLDTSGTRTFPSECKMEVDIYEVTLSREAYENTGGTSTHFTSLTGLFNTSATYSETLKDNNTSPSTTEININHRGSTPFEMSYALSRFGIKIWKKTKFMLNQNETITYQLRDPRRHVLNNVDQSQVNGFNKPGWSKFLFIVGKLVPGCTPIAALNGYTERLSIGISRKYMFKIEGQTEDRSLYLAQ